MALASATIDVGDGLADYYSQNGYAVVRGLVELALIDTLLAAYARDIVPSKSKFFRQNTNRYEPNRMSEFGFVGHSLARG